MLNINICSDEFNGLKRYFKSYPKKNTFYPLSVFFFCKKKET